MKKPKQKIDLDHWSVNLYELSLIWLPGDITFKFRLRRKNYPPGGFKPGDFMTMIYAPLRIETYEERKINALVRDAKRILIDVVEGRISERGSP